MNFLIHTEFDPVNLDQVCQVRKESVNKIVFVWSHGGLSEWEFKSTDKRNQYYLQIVTKIAEDGGIMLA